MPRLPGAVSGASRVCSAFPLVDPLPSTGSADDDPSLFARFLGTMGPSDSLETCMSEVRRFAFSARPTLLRRRSFLGLPVSVQRVSTHAQGLRLRGVHQRLAIIVVHDVAFPLSGQGRHAELLISELNGWPACAPVNASPAVLPPPAHDSGLERFATPFPCGSFIRYSLPALTGGFPDPILPPADLTYAEATTLQSGDTVVEQDQSWFDADGNVIATADYQRLPGDTTSTGAHRLELIRYRLGFLLRPGRPRR